MAELELLTEIAGGIARIVFNRPHARNALTPPMLSAMLDFLIAIEHDPAVRCVIMQGQGAHFMAGGDVAGFAEAATAPACERRRDFAERARSGIEIFSVLQRLTKPVIAKVRGAVAGASIGWVAAADFAIASETSLFVFAHIHLGTSPDGGLTWHLPRLIGLRRAKELILLGERLDAAGALAAGLVNRVLNDDALDTDVEALAQRLATGPSIALGHTKRLLNHAALHDQATQMELEAEAFGACAASRDFAEGVAAFSEKRRAVFAGE